jgi:hypothetical protein
LVTEHYYLASKIPRLEESLLSQVCQDAQKKAIQPPMNVDER